MIRTVDYRTAGEPFRIVAGRGQPVLLRLRGAERGALVAPPAGLDVSVHEPPRVDRHQFLDHLET
jgi:hypothetical protein